MSRILLVVPTVQYEFSYPHPVSITDLPIGMAYISAALKRDGHEVYAANCNNRLEFPDARSMVRGVVSQVIADCSPNWIMTGGLCTDYACIKEIIRTCNQQSPSTPVVLGGSIVTHDQATPYMLGADYGIAGEAEHTVAKFLSGGMPCENTIGWGKTTDISWDVPPIDSLPYPDYSIFGGWDEIAKWGPAIRYNYRFPVPDEPRPLAIVAGRSCVFHCTFCIQGRPKYRTRSPASIITEMQEIKAEYDFNIVFFMDELFAASSHRLSEFSQAVLDSGLKFKWQFQTHASSRLNRESLLLAKEAGLCMFTYGLESAAPAVLESMDKRTTPEMVADGMRLANETGIGFGANVIFGDPAETGTTIRQTMQFIKKHSRGVHMWVSGVNPYPGSALFTRCLQDGTIYDRHQYYETIDRCRVNMTRLPSILFKPWLALVSWMGGNGLWMPVAKARNLRTYRTETMIADEMVADCPHCGSQVTHREYRLPQRVKEHAMSLPQNTLTTLLQYTKNTEAFLWFVMILAWLIEPLSPWWGSLRTLKHPGRVPVRAYRAGCPACNKALRICVRN